MYPAGALHKTAAFLLKVHLIAGLGIIARTSCRPFIWAHGLRGAGLERVAEALDSSVKENGSWWFT